MFSPKARSFAWAALESGGLSLLSFVALLVVARLVGPAEVGMFALALGTVQILTTIVEMLIHDAIVQRRDLTDVHLQSAFWTTLFLGAGFTALCFVLAPRFASYLAKPELEAI